MFSSIDRSLCNPERTVDKVWLRTFQCEHTRNYLFDIVKLPSKQGKVQDTYDDLRPTEEEKVVSVRLHDATCIFKLMTEGRPFTRSWNCAVIVYPFLECTEVLQILCDRARLFHNISTTVISVYRRLETTSGTPTMVGGGEKCYRDRDGHRRRTRIL